MVTKQFYNKQLNLGAKIELEHTKSKNRARKIAEDHLRESPYYYIELKKMERKLKIRR